MKADRDQHQTSQRLRVGLAGLAAVVLLIGLASTIIASLTPDRPAGRSNEIAVDLGTGNEDVGTSEPLAELGATPGTLNDQVAAAQR